MIFNIGIDAVEIERIKKISNMERFIKRVFTENEIRYFSSKKDSFLTIAGYFAAKEAISKALSTGIIFCFKDIEIVKTDKGCPRVILYNKAKKISSDFGITNIVISITHQNSIAIACAIAEKKG